MKDINDFLNNSLIGSFIKMAVFVALIYGSQQVLAARLDAHEKNQLETTARIVKVMDDLEIRLRNQELRGAFNEGSLTGQLKTLSDRMGNIEKRLGITSH